VGRDFDSRVYMRQSNKNLKQSEALYEGLWSPPKLNLDVE